MAVRTGLSCCLYQSRSGLFQRYLSAELAADASPEPLVSLIVGARRFAQTLLAQPLWRILGLRHYPNESLFTEVAFDIRPSNRVHRDEDPGSDRRKRKVRAPTQLLVARVVEIVSLKFFPCAGRHFNKEFGFHKRVSSFTELR